VRRELLPSASAMAFLINPTDSVYAEMQSREALAAAHTLGLGLHVLNASSERDFDVNILMTDRLASDMRPFIYQVQSACDYVKGAAAWLSGQVPPKHEDNEQMIGDARPNPEDCHFRGGTAAWRLARGTLPGDPLMLRLWLNVNALIQSCVFLLPTSLIHEKPPQLFMRFHPKHSINMIFLKHRVPSSLINLPFDQVEIVT
jgi:uncharacterized protein DUF1993